MSIYLHLKVVGALLVTLALANTQLARYFKWKNELAHVSLLTRQIFQVHGFFIVLVVGMMGACSLFYTDALLASGALSRIVLAGLVVFWISRLAIQFFVYDPAIWRGRRFYTIMHVVFSILWIYVALTYSAALHIAWKGAVSSIGPSAL
ncbi:MAG TPA: hypothetical protein VGP62_26290 [Bryobacteraceae bacterium]|jgi:hypothetical protein|nr:hypothetical protein [Bryobacteraceae bacterium]